MSGLKRICKRHGSITVIDSKGKKSEWIWDYKNDKPVLMSESGFFDLPNIEKCKDPSHKPPTHIHIPRGKGYRHVCPSCGKVIDLIPPQITL